MKKTFSFTFFIVFTFLAFSQNNPAGKTLTLNEAVKIALENNSIVRQVQNYVERDQASVMAAYGNFLPSASMSASWGGSKGESFIPEFGSFPSTTSRSLSTSIGTNVTLFDGFSNTSTLDAAIANAQST